MATLKWIDYAVMGLYAAFVLGIGILLKRGVKSSMDFFLSGRAIPGWITGLAFISANLGAQEVIGMGASGKLSPSGPGHGFPAWTLQLPPLQVSAPLQNSPSVQASLLFACVQPVVALQPSVVHGLLSLQLSLAPPEHTPVEPHFSPVVQALPSLQAARTSTSVVSFGGASR